MNGREITKNLHALNGFVSEVLLCCIGYQKCCNIKLCGGTKGKKDVISAEDQKELTSMRLN